MLQKTIITLIFGLVALQNYGMSNILRFAIYSKKGLIEILRDAFVAKAEEGESNKFIENKERFLILTKENLKEQEKNFLTDAAGFWNNKYGCFDTLGDVLNLDERIKFFPEVHFFEVLQKNTGILEYVELTLDYKINIFYKNLLNWLSKEEKSPMAEKIENILSSESPNMYKIWDILRIQPINNSEGEKLWVEILDIRSKYHDYLKLEKCIAKNYYSELVKK